MFDDCVEAGLRPAWTGRSLVPTQKPAGRKNNRCLLLFDFFQSCGLALEPAQVVKLGAADFSGAYDVNLVDNLGVDGENTFHTLAETDFADRKTWLGASRPGNDDAFERLQTLLFALSDLDQYLDRIAGTKLGDVGAARFRQQFFDNRIAHNVSFLNLALDLGQQFLIFRRQRNPLQQIGTVAQRFCQRRLAAPAANL